MQSPFGVEHGGISKRDLTRKQRSEVASDATVGGIAGAAYGGFPAAAGIQHVGMKAKNKLKAADEHAMANAPTYRRYEKAKNLYERAGTEGEKAAAGAASERLKAKAEGERKAAYKGIKGLRRARVLSHLPTSNKGAIIAGVTAAGVAGASALGGISYGAQKRQAAARAAARKPKPVALAKRDYSKARAHWTRQQKIGNRVENTGGTVAGVAGATMGGAALRDALFKDRPGSRVRAVKMTSKLPPQVAETLLNTKPGLKVLAAAAGGTAVGYVGNRHKRLAEKKVARYSVHKGVEPGSLMHRHDLETVSKLMSDSQLSHRKKVAAGVGTATATMGLAALGSKGISALIPKVGGAIGKTPKARAYARKLDSAATTLTIGAAGVGGAGGLNGAAIQRDEAERVQPVNKPGKKLAKAFDPEERRVRRNNRTADAVPAVLGTGAAAAAVHAARPNRGVEFRSNKGARDRAYQASRTAHQEAYSMYKDAKAAKGSVKRAKGMEDAYFKVNSAYGYKDAGRSHSIRMKALKIPMKSRVRSGAVAAGLGAAAVAAHKNKDKVKGAKTLKPYTGRYSS
jgi:hypothetical protein